MLNLHTSFDFLKGASDFDHKDFLRIRIISYIRRGKIRAARNHRMRVRGGEAMGESFIMAELE